MKHLIRFSFFIAVIAVAIISCQKTTNQAQTEVSQDLELRSDDPCFRSPAASCDNGTFTNAITLPGFGDCNFIVTLDYFYCYGGIGIANYIVSDYEMVEYQCVFDSYEDSLAFHASNGTLAEFEERFNKLVWAAITDALLTNTNNVVYSSTITYKTRSCVKTCYYVVQKGELSFIGNTKLGCGTGCCKIFRNYEKINGEWVLQSIQDASDPANCFDDENNICPLGTIYTSDCRQQCDDLLF